MVWDQQELFVGVLAEFASAQTIQTMLAHAREFDWASSMREADLRHSAEWRRRNPRKAKAYGDAYREANRERERQRVAAWRAANRDRVKTAAAEYRAKNRETERARKARWCEADRQRAERGRAA